MDPRIVKFGRIALIPVCLILVYSAYANLRDINTTIAGRKIFERSLTEAWPTAQADMGEKFTIWHGKPYKKGEPMKIEPNYSYRVGAVSCQSNRFEFGPRTTSYTEVPAGDKRLNDMVKSYCRDKPVKTEEKDKVKYDYRCYPIQVFYDPLNTCLSYIAKPNNPDVVRYALKKNISSFALWAFIKAILAAGCAFGALPVLRQLKRRFTK